MKKEVEAMMSLEAAIIMPLSLMVCILVLWSGMLLYNRSAALNAVSVASIQAARQAEAENEEIRTLASDKVKELLKDRLILMQEESIEVSVDGDSVSVGYSGRMTGAVIPVIGSSVLFDWSVNAQKESPRLKEAMIVRTIDRIKKGLE